MPPEFEEGIIEELAQHLEQRYEEMLGSGVSVETAEHEVASEVCGEKLREQVRRIAKRYESRRHTALVPDRCSWAAAMMSRPQIRLSRTAPESRIHDRRPVITRTWNWGQHSNLRNSERTPTASAPGQSSGRTHRSAYDRHEGASGSFYVSRLC